MRITGGAWRSRRILGPTRGMPLRPTPDAMRERVFQILGGRLEGAVFLDLFAGTGVVGLEALSRGAARVVFVERHRAAVRLIRRNLENFPEIGERATVLSMGVERVADRLNGAGNVFDIAWADPPFENWLDGARALEVAGAAGLLAPGAVRCLECPDRADLDRLPEGLRVEREIRGGASRVVLLSGSD